MTCRDDRAQTMAELYRAGASLEKVGRQFGITRQRVEQILSGICVKRRSPAEAQLLRRTRPTVTAILDAHRRTGSLGAAARELGQSPYLLRKVLEGSGIPKPEPRRPPGRFCTADPEHTRTPETTYYTGRGRPYCALCFKARQERSKARLGQLPMRRVGPYGPKMHLRKNGPKPEGAA